MEVQPHHAGQPGTSHPGSNEDPCGQLWQLMCAFTPCSTAFHRTRVLLAHGYVYGGCVIEIRFPLHHSHVSHPKFEMQKTALPCPAVTFMSLVCVVSPLHENTKHCCCISTAHGTHAAVHCILSVSGIMHILARPRLTQFCCMCREVCAPPMEQACCDTW